LVSALVSDSVERPQNTVLADSRNEASFFAADAGLEHWADLREIPIVIIVGSQLFIPTQLSSLDVERNDRIRVQVWTGPEIRRQVRRGIGDGNIQFAAGHIQ